MFNKIINRMNKQKRRTEKYLDKQEKEFDWENTYIKIVRINDEIKQLKASE